jgi:hypothetical protein
MGVLPRESGGSGDITETSFIRPRRQSIYREETLQIKYFEWCLNRARTREPLSLKLPIITKIIILKYPDSLDVDKTYIWINYLYCITFPLAELCAVETSLKLDR